MTLKELRQKYTDLSADIKLEVSGSVRWTDLWNERAKIVALIKKLEKKKK